MMKLSLVEVLVLLGGVIVVAPMVVALLTPTTDAVTMGLWWLFAVAVFLAGFFGARLVYRRR